MPRPILPPSDFDEEPITSLTSRESYYETRQRARDRQYDRMDRLRAQELQEKVKHKRLLNERLEVEIEYLKLEMELMKKKHES